MFWDETISRNMVFQRIVSKQFGQRLNDNDVRLQQAFKSATGSQMRYIDPDSDDGMSILACVAKANKVVESTSAMAGG
jgi:hypothetical protein